MRQENYGRKGEYYESLAFIGSVGSFGAVGLRGK